MHTHWRDTTTVGHTTDENTAVGYLRGVAACVETATTMPEPLLSWDTVGCDGPKARRTIVARSPSSKRRRRLPAPQEAD